MNNETMMQSFEWYLANDGLWWKRCAVKAEHMASIGITYVWLPPAYKGKSQEDVGYAVYDMYDLGEFEQKGTIRTKYGTKDEYFDAIKAFHEHGIKVFADIVINHRVEGDEAEEVLAVPVNPQNRNEQIGDEKLIKVHSRFTFPGRAGKHSSFTWNHNHFTGTDWDENEPGPGQIYRFSGKQWETDVDPENGNYDYLLGLDVDYGNAEVVHETKKWLHWYIKTAGIDGFRLDAVKHISAEFYNDLLKYIRKQTGMELPAVGEYWSNDLGRLLYYLDSCENEMSLFDVPLHYNFFSASQAGGAYDLRTILDNTLMKERPQNAVTFVDNHDTQRGQSLQSAVGDWFKDHCYAIIMLRQGGLPCVFYSDYHGNPVRETPAVLNLGKMIMLRHFYAYGEQEDYFESQNLIGWVRRGDEEHSNSGLAAVLSNGDNSGPLHMFMGEKFADAVFSDVLGNCTEKVTIGKDGWADFSCVPGRVSIWVTQEAFENLIVYE
ncbi:MAG: alpha-amylase [Anaerolineaceae bacterium]|nr:alpha-amylase [Anaerolineaceae bacterium]